jgi:hypothetical protein
LVIKSLGPDPDSLEMPDPVPPNPDHWFRDITGPHLRF